ncbi:MAG: hypothetical protein E7525_02190 [Ruminococcaceae bacterium]|nr:hypothetical protein [Oscillospiraceae bacterium]
MRILRLTIIFLAIAVTVASVGIVVANKGKDVAPVITCSVEGDIVASVYVTDNDLIQYVTVTDEQDGDITDRVRVIRKKYFVDDKVSVITYAVSDTDNNVTLLQKRIRFDDYTPPELSLKSDLIFKSGKTIPSLSSYVTAYDQFDRDLTNYVKIISTEFTSVAGEYPINIKVSNSMGDTEDITIDGIVIDDYNENVRINLNKYLLYYDGVSEVDWMSYVESVRGGGYSISDVRVDLSETDFSRPGVNNVFFRIKQGNEDVTLTRMIVVIREG